MIKTETLHLAQKFLRAKKQNLFRKQKKLNLSLSEWICGTLDMSLNAYEDVNKITEVKQLQEENAEKDKIIKSLSSKLELNKLYLEMKNQKVLQQDKTIMELNDLIQKLHRRLGYSRNSD